MGPNHRNGAIIRCHAQEYVWLAGKINWPYWSISKARPTFIVSPSSLGRGLVFKTDDPCRLLEERPDGLVLDWLTIDQLLAGAFAVIPYRICDCSSTFHGMKATSQKTCALYANSCGWHLTNDQLDDFDDITVLLLESFLGTEGRDL
jgi:hypothetical protein